MFAYGTSVFYAITIILLITPLVIFLTHNELLFLPSSVIICATYNFANIFSTRCFVRQFVLLTQTAQQYRQTTDNNAKQPHRATFWHR